MEDVAIVKISFFLEILKNHIAPIFFSGQQILISFPKQNICKLESFGSSFIFISVFDHIFLDFEHLLFVGKEYYRKKVDCYIENMQEFALKTLQCLWKNFRNIFIAKNGASKLPNKNKTWRNALKFTDLNFSQRQKQAWTLFCRENLYISIEQKL